MNYRCLNTWGVQNVSVLSHLIDSHKLVAIQSAPEIFALLMTNKQNTCSGGHFELKSMIYDQIYLFFFI